jgi:hypothetical protein
MHRASASMTFHTPLPIDRTMLQAIDTGLLASGRTEESIIDGVEEH